MAYQEYATETGVRRQHQNGRLPRRVEYHPNSKHWHDQAQSAAALLIERLGGREAYHAWCDENLPDTPASWQALALRLGAELERHS